MLWQQIIRRVVHTLKPSRASAVSHFREPPNGLRPDFCDVAVTDFGQTVRLGNCGAPPRDANLTMVVQKVFEK
jgi:hypothetical protein